VNSADYARRVRAGARRRTGQWTVTIRCTTGLFGGPAARSSNGRTLTVGWRGWRTGQCPVAHRTVRCAHQQQSSPTTTLVVGDINTPQPPHFKASKFSAIAFNTRALDFTPRHKQEIKSSPESKDHSKHLVTSERERFVFIWVLVAWIAFLLPPFLFSTPL
jgi:hypothetical protein